MRQRSGLRGAPVILVWLLLVAGCGTSGLQSAVPPEKPRPADSVYAALGDPRTVDPCTLTDPALLQPFGQITSASTVSLDYCLLQVRTSDGSLAQLTVGQLGAADPAATEGSPVTRRGTFGIVQDAPLPGHCTRQVLFSDGVAMQVNADLLTGSPGAGLCGIAEAGARGAVDVMARGGVGHRPFPPNSLALMDPCAVLDSAVVRQIPGLEESQPVPSPARHQCQWGQQDAQSPRVRMVHTAGDPPKMLHGAAVQEEIAGRQTVLSVVGGDPSVPLCSAETGHIPFGDARSGQVEVAMLVVAVPGEDGIGACEFARGLAQAAWPALPVRG